ncbi:long-chain fatty acid transporter [Legionella norrlandica]|uniref:Long-chain fatty acid transporter n=1 Tax=Legionella norrlandica TaxID=1498499 RepID=A0A0A2SSF5_9GAMM|nr:outer membrane protein transport protein [Legionella norrlandica]KGP63687.1 long-chain fatty acid transporter [Legionella norrlandica]
MKIRHKPLRTLVSTAVLGVLTASAVNAGGFSLYTESTGYTTGNFAAGVAAEAADASTGWYNPAGLTLIREQQAVFSGVGVFPTAKLSGVSTFSGPPPLPDYVEVFNNVNGAEDAFVPSFHYALPVGESTTVGLSIVSPFGLSTNWGPTSPVRYQATYTELLTTNISPEIGGKLTDHLSVGAGLDLQYARVKFNRMIGIPTIFGNIIPPFNPMLSDSFTYNKGHSFGVGFHAGVLGMFNDNHTRLGVNYQSEMRHEFHGFSRLTGPLANPTNIFAPDLPPGLFRTDDLYSNSIDLPDVITISGYHDINEKLALLGSLVYTGWSSFKVIQLNNVAAPSVNPGTGAISLVKVTSASPQNYSDTLRVAVGANYYINDKLMLRAGGGYDPTPTNDIDRDVRLPDTDRWALSVGAHYQARNNIGVDLGYTHLFTHGDPVVNRTDVLTPTTSYNVTATGTAGANLVGAQVVWTIDQPPPVPTK